MPKQTKGTDSILRLFTIFSHTSWNTFKITVQTMVLQWY